MPGDQSSGARTPLVSDAWVDRLGADLLDLEMQLREVAHERQLRGPARSAGRRQLDQRERYVRAQLERREHHLALVLSKAIADRPELAVDVAQLGCLEPAALVPDEDLGEV